MWLIPGKTKIKIEIFKGVGIADILIGIVMGGLLLLLFISNMPFKYVFMTVLALVTIILLARVDDEPNYIFFLHIVRHLGFTRHYLKPKDDKLLLSQTRVGEKQAAMEAFYSEEEGEKKPESREERKARKQAERALYKKESARLKAKDLTKEEENEIWKARAKRSRANAARRKQAAAAAADWGDMDDIISFTGIRDNYIEFAGQYFGIALELTPVEFRFFSQTRRNASINNGIGRILRSLNPDYYANIVKIDRPVHYERYIEAEKQKLEALRSAFEKGMMKEDELKARVEVVYNRLSEIEGMMDEDKIIIPFYYLVLFDADKSQLEHHAADALSALEQAEIPAQRLDDRDLALFLKYTNTLDVNEKELEELEIGDYAAWAKPSQLDLHIRTTEVNHILTHTMRVSGYMQEADDAWMATVMSMPGTKCMVKVKPMDSEKAVRSIDRSLQELRSQLNSTNVDSKVIELQTHIESLGELLNTLSGENETLLNMNFYVTCYDIVGTENSGKAEHITDSLLPRFNGMKKAVKRLYRENGLRLSDFHFEQTEAFIATQVSSYDPFAKKGRGIPSNSISAGYPWVFATVSDVGGIKLGASDGVPVFIDFFRRDSERVNSNMVIVGKSGSGKSYATKSLLTNLAADDSKIFILDPENEYTELAANLHGQFINVGNAQYGRLNPFHIMTALDDDEQEEGTVSGSYATHMQFLEEFFHQIIPDCEKDAMEYLNSIIDRMYTEKGITPETNLSVLKPEDYPVFDDLYDAILQELQKTDNEYIRSMLRTLMNYIAKFSTGGRNANIWNGPSTVTTDENFTVFNFQSLLSNRNGAIANAQMLLVLKYIDNEIIKNRDYNTRNHRKRKVIVVIDEAHVFIDEKFPIALDFMFQMAKRIRKYNGMQIVITQNIKDFVGTEELVRKSTAIINACQYSFIFPLAPNDMEDLCKLYEKAGGINENEQEQIIQAPRGQAFTILSSQSRSSFKVEVPQSVVTMFQEPQFESEYFTDDPDDKNWMDYLGDSREKYNEVIAERELLHEQMEAQLGQEVRKFVSFSTITEEELAEEQAKQAAQSTTNAVDREETLDMDAFLNIEDIPEDPAEFAAMMRKKSSENVRTDQQMDRNPTSDSQLKDVAKVLGQMAENNALMMEQSRLEAEKAASRTEERMTELLSKLSVEHMMQSIQQTVELEVQKRVAETIAAMNLTTAAAMSQEIDQQLPMTEASATGTDGMGTPEREAPSMETPVMGVPTMPGQSFALGNIFARAEDEAPAQTNAKASVLTPEAVEYEEDPEGFNLMALLAAEAESFDSVSAIEQMELYDETVIDITLEDMTLYIKNLRNKLQ